MGHFSPARTVSSGRLLPVKQSRRDNKGRAGGADLEAIGLVVVAVGVFLLGVLVPVLPTGELGRTVRGALVGPVGWLAYAAPLPPLVLGALFLLRRNPSWWPRLFAGYAVLLIGLWGVSAAVAPQIAGAWGAGLRATLGQAWGFLAAIPAVVVATIGIDLIAGLTPTKTLRSALGTTAGFLRRVFDGAMQARGRARERAGLHADAAQLRRGLSELDKDLQALSSLYPGSGELQRWREEVKASSNRLRQPTTTGLKEAKADLKAWSGAVGDFARDRAGDMVVHLDSEAALSPEPEAGGFEAWCQALRQGIDDPIEAGNRASLALDRVRKALALDLTALVERHRRLTRERDIDKRALKGMTPRQLVQASKAHEQRLIELARLEADADALSVDADALEPWRALSEKLAVGLDEFADGEELQDYVATLAKELDSKGRQALVQVDGWNQALDAVLERAWRESQRTAQAAAQAAAEREAAANLTDPMGGFTTDEDDVDDMAPWNSSGSWEGAAAGGGSGSSGSGARRSVQATVIPTVVHTADSTPSQAQHLTGAVQAALLADDEVPAGGAAAAAGVAQRETGKTPASLRLGPVAAARSVTETEERAAIPEVGGIPIQLPPLDLLDEPESPHLDRSQLTQEHRARVKQIDDTFHNFKLGGRVVAAVRGPTVTRFEVEPAPGEKISRFANLSDDLALAMAAASVRIEAPIPGKSVIGLEVPNSSRELVRFREAAESGSFKRAKARLPIILGKSIDNELVVGDLARMPHLLIAGSTGSGKSVAINTVVGSLLYRFLPTELRFLMIDPKMVELTPFDGIPHLLRPVVTNPSDAAGVLLGAVSHMERRYKMMSKLGAKNLDQYNEKARNLDLPPLPFIAIVIDELADLMITSPKEVESAIMRLAQMARATGMHLILATQRPSVDILTSLIKVNVPARMAFAVSSSHDSRTILDSMGAERLIGMGDMLFYQPGLVKAVRLQGPFISEAEVARVSGFLRRQFFDDDFVEAYGPDFDPPSLHESDASGLIDWNDDKLRVAAELVVSEGQASVSRLQRRLGVGHARAGKLMDSLEALGVVGPHQGSKPRDVLVAFEELPNVFGK